MKRTYLWYLPWVVAALVVLVAGLGVV